MTNPHGLTDGDMLLLLATSVGNGPDVIGGELAIPDPATPGGAVPAPDGSLDRLEAAGMVEIVESGAAVTSKGSYWLDRWMRTRFKLRGLVITKVTKVGRG